MKNSNLIGAVMMVSLSFTACQKDEVLAPRLSANGQTERAISHAIAQQFPLKVNDLVTGKAKLFFYDDLKQLTMVKDGAEDMAFSYDRSGRVLQIAITNVRNSRGGSKILAMKYDGDMALPSMIEEQAVSSGNDEMLKTTLVKYDSQMNKISEMELGADRSVLLSRLFTYDNRGNCIEYREIRNNLVVKDMKFADFDLRPSQVADVKVLALLPGTIFQKSNARTVVEVLPIRSIVEPKIETLSDLGSNATAKLINNTSGQNSGLRTIHYKFLYNSFGFPTDVIQIQSDFEETIQTIEYMTNQW